ncbi:MAG: hypothetical protein R3F60_18650 [bacterium]
MRGRSAGCGWRCTWRWCRSAWRCWGTGGHRRRRGGGWLAFGLVFAPFLALALAYIRATYRGSTPGIKNDGVQVHELSGRRVGAYLLGTAITSLYVILYWFPGPWPGWCR